jgi:hypothetical protein
VLLTEMRRATCPVAPRLSVTLSVTMYEVGTFVGAANVCDGFACVLMSEPSPKSQRYVSGPISGSVEALPSNSTVSGPSP